MRRKIDEAAYHDNTAKMARGIYLVCFFLVIACVVAAEIFLAIGLAMAAVMCLDIANNSERKRDNARKTKP
jgi:hypothetical protein